MLREKRILAAMIQEKKSFQVLMPTIEETDFTILGWLIYQEIAKYYERDPQTDFVHLDLLISQLKQKFPKRKEEISVLLQDIFTISTPNVLNEHIKLKETSTKQALAYALLEDNEKDIQMLQEKLAVLQSKTDKKETEVYTEIKVDSILGTMAPENIIRLRPQPLSNALDGGVIPGMQIAIYAPTEVGKTLLAVNMTCGLLRDGKKVLYCGNEDPIKSIIMRVYTNLTNMTKQQILLRAKPAQAEAEKNGINNLTLLDMSPGSIPEIRKAVEEHRPDVMFIDQMANLEHGHSNKVEKNEALASQLRSLAKKYNIVSVIIHQGSDDSYGKLVLQKNHLYYSNVGVQGQMDIMIGIGMNDEYEHTQKRMLCLTKNKVNGRHDNIPIAINEEMSLIYDEPNTQKN